MCAERKHTKKWENKMRLAKTFTFQLMNWLYVNYALHGDNLSCLCATWLRSGTDIWAGSETNKSKSDLNEKWTVQIVEMGKNTFHFTLRWVHSDNILFVHTQRTRRKPNQWLLNLSPVIFHLFTEYRMQSAPILGRQWRPNNENNVACNWADHFVRLWSITNRL